MKCCPQCGKQNPDNSAFCEQCGANLAAAAPPPAMPAPPPPPQDYDMPSAQPGYAAPGYPPARSAEHYAPGSFIELRQRS